MKTATAKGLMLLTIVAASISVSNAFGQSGNYGMNPQPQNYGGDYSYGYGFGYSPSTAAESWYRGYADLVRAWGENNYKNSMAQVYWEQAREKAIANRTAKVEQYFALRKFNEEQRLSAIAKSRLSRQQLVAISKKSAPQRLGEEHWNPATGGLAWPVALRGDDFAAARDRMDELFQLRRDASSGLTSDEKAEAQNMARAMTDSLKDRISQVRATDYAAAKRFLTSLTHELSLEPSTGERLAQR